MRPHTDRGRFDLVSTSAMPERAEVGARPERQRRRQHQDVELRRTVRPLADRLPRDDGAVVRQGVEPSRGAGRAGPAKVAATLERLSQHITPVEIHLGDQNGAAGHGCGEQPDKRCLMEARLEGRQPVGVIGQAGTLDQAVQGSADNLVRMIDGALGRSARGALRGTTTLSRRPQPLADRVGRRTARPVGMPCRR